MATATRGANPEPGTCRGCGARIGWLKTVAGRPMCVNLTKQTIVANTPEGAKIINGYEPHWATCPNAGDFKRPRKDWD